MRTPNQYIADWFPWLTRGRAIGGAFAISLLIVFIWPHAHLVAEVALVTAIAGSISAIVYGLTFWSEAPVLVRRSKSVRRRAGIIAIACLPLLLMQRASIYLRSPRAVATEASAAYPDTTRWKVYVVVAIARLEGDDGREIEGRLRDALADIDPRLHVTPIVLNRKIAISGRSPGIARIEALGSVTDLRVAALIWGGVKGAAHRAVGPLYETSFGSNAQFGGVYLPADFKLPNSGMRLTGSNHDSLTIGNTGSGVTMNCRRLSGCSLATAGLSIGSCRSLAIDQKLRKRAVKIVAAPGSNKMSTPTTYIALLRGINVGGHKAVAMAELRGLLTELGFVGVRSLLQSGNLVFQHDAVRGADIERILEIEADKRLGLQTDFLIRNAKEWKEIVARNPFRTEAEHDPSHLVVRFLKSAPNAKEVKALQGAITGPEIIRPGGRQVHIVYPAGIGESRLTNALLEAKLGRGTSRNWNTVLKLAALVDDILPLPIGERPRLRRG